MPNIKPGSHLIVRRWGYSHHGIYVGRNRVVHYTATSSNPKLAIASTPFEEFAAGGRWRVKAYNKPYFTGPEIVRRARARLGESMYNLVFNNCEHFASYCVTGQHLSSQVNMAAGRIGAGVLSQLLGDTSRDGAARTLAGAVGRQAAAKALGPALTASAASKAGTTAAMKLAAQGLSGVAATSIVSTGIAGATAGVVGGSLTAVALPLAAGFVAIKVVGSFLNWVNWLDS